MKSSSIRVRIEEAEKAKIEVFAARTRRTISDILREAVTAAIHGEIPGLKERLAYAAVRRSSNHLLAILGRRPIEMEDLKSAVMQLRTTVRELVQCR